MDAMYGDQLAVWSALALVLSILGGLWARHRWQHRGVGAGLRALAVALLPLAALLTGTLRLVTRIGSAIADWATHLVLSPVVWIGVALAGGSVALWVIGTAVAARTSGPAPVEATPGQPKRVGRREGSGSGDSGDLSDMDDINEILRRHGIQ